MDASTATVIIGSGTGICLTTFAVATAVGCLFFAGVLALAAVALNGCISKDDED